MNKILSIASMASMIPGVALAESGPESLIPYPDWIIFGLALIVTAWWSNQAFDRRSFDLAGSPTYPQYMTRPSQYRLGRITFVLLSIAIYALMIRYHKDLPQIVKAVKPEWYDPLKSLIDDKDPSYLVVVIIVSACFLTLLKVEKKWNVYLLLRDMIYYWVAIPYLTKRIVQLTKDRLDVPRAARQHIARSKPDWRVHEEDFEKNKLSMDRAWAELCYLQWWILEQYRTTTDTTFFSEESFRWDEVQSEFANLHIIVAAKKEGIASTDDQSAEIMLQIEEHRKKLGRLIACYLVFMNSSRSSLATAAASLAIPLGPPHIDNPLRYAAIYIVALLFAVNLGVFLSAVMYDVIQGVAIRDAIIDQDTTNVQRWVFLAFGNYGIPILGILVLRYLAWLRDPARGYSILVAYAWIFLIAAILSTLGLSLMVELVGRNAGHWDEFFQVCQRELKWSIGPALICVFINHFLDRQIDPTLPNIEPPAEMPFRRIGYAILFTLIVIAFTLPSMPTIPRPPDGPWELSKLRFVAMGTIFFITMAMALVAQFALTKPRSKQPTTSNAPENPDPELASM
jgi:hypothetical protein